MDRVSRWLRGSVLISPRHLLLSLFLPACAGAPPAVKQVPVKVDDAAVTLEPAGLRVPKAEFVRRLQAAGRVECYDILLPDPAEARAIFRPDWEQKRAQGNRVRQKAEIDDRVAAVKEFLAVYGGQNGKQAELARRLDSLAAAAHAKIEAGEGYRDAIEALTSAIEEAIAQVMARPASPPETGALVGQVIRSYLSPPVTWSGRFVPIRAGSFVMGTPVGEPERGEGEDQHPVTLREDFEIGVTEVTQAQWFQVTGANPAYHRLREHCPDSHKVVDGTPLCPDWPVEEVPWIDVQDFLTQLNRQATDGYVYSLPSEAQWEYAARAGTRTAYSYGASAKKLPEYGWFWANSGGQSHAVATRKSNPWGLFDVHGNVWEWTQDSHGSGSDKVCKGGCWYCNARGLRSGYRGWGPQDGRSEVVGFRLIRRKR